MRAEADLEMFRALGDEARRRREEDVDPALLVPFDAKVQRELLSAAVAALGGPQVVPLRRRTPKLVGAVLSAAAALILVVALPRGPELVAPEYSLELRAGAAEVRGAHAGTRFGPEDRVEILLRPATETAGLAARIFVRDAAGLRERPVEIDDPKTGAFRVRTTGAALLDGPGAAVLYFVIGPADAIRDADAEALVGGRIDGTRVLEHAIAE